MFRSLANRNYRIWFIGALISNVGGWMQATTQNWVVLTELTDNDAIAVGITMALQFGPQLLLVPITGWIADRFDRRRVLAVTQSALMLLGIGLGLLLLSGQAELWHLYLFALGFGIVNAADTPARQTLVTDLVHEEYTSNAIALNSASFNAARMIGPAVAGVLIVAVGAGWVFLLNAVTFLAVLVALVLIRPEELRARPSSRGQSGQLVAGFRYVGSRPDLVVIFVIVFLFGGFGMNFPIYASTMSVEFGRGAGEYGLLSSILAIGSLAGALLAARRPKARLRVAVAASAGFGVAALAAALMPDFWSFAAMSILLGFTAVTVMTTANGLVQSSTPAIVRGRVMALYMAVVMGGTPIGAPIVGAVADALNPRWALGLAAAVAVLASLIALVWAFSTRRLRFGRNPESRLGFGVLPGDLPLTGPIPVAVPADFSEEVALTSPIALPVRPEGEDARRL